MPKLHLRQPGFTYSFCRPFTKHRERTKKSKEMGDLKYIYKNELNKACFAHDATYSDSNTVRKTIFSYSKCSEKMIFPKKAALVYDLSCIIRKDDITFSRKYDLIL